MTKTKIEWCDQSVNPVKGKCPVACQYCYARRLYDRFKWDPSIRLEKEGMYLSGIKQPSRIFVGSTMELWGPWIQWEWQQWIMGVVNCHPQHTFIFLTKCPEGMLQWSPFPHNVWVGFSAATKLQFYAGCHHFAKIEAKVKFISFEPLQEAMSGHDPVGTHLKNAGIRWVIIGQQTPARPKTTPDIKWVKHIVSQATRSRIPVFMKDNLVPLVRADNQQICNDCEAGDPCQACGAITRLQQDFPKVKKNGKN